MSHVYLLLFQYEMWFSPLDVLADAQQTPDHLSDRLCSQSLHTIICSIYKFNIRLLAVGVVIDVIHFICYEVLQRVV